MDFNRRLRLFLFGVIAGSLVVWALLFRNRDLPAWTPNDRVMESLRQNPIKIMPAARCMLDCNGISDKDVINVLQTGKVIFSESNVRGKEIPEYIIEGKQKKGTEVKMLFSSNYLETRLHAVPATEQLIDTCACAGK
jgi:hypothetical protein